ncbi:MAG: HAMP domain-containing protein, partial [bacterium]|nr:HAMP domain-containing protein [bacterium]
MDSRQASEISESGSGGIFSALKNLPIKYKISGGFGLVLLLILALVGVVQSGLSQVAQIQTRVIELRMPTNLAGHDLTNGINYSLAALRGWMILGKEQFKDQRGEAWDGIDSHLATMTKMAENWTVAANVEKLDQLKAVLGEFREAQDKVEAVSNTVDEQPAVRLLLTEAAPKAGVIVKAITGMINDEKAQETTAERKALLATLADSRGSFALGLASIRAFLIGGETKWREDFENRWKVNSARLQTLEDNRHLFTAKQNQHFETYSKTRKEFEPLPARMFEIRGSAKWNMANYLLGSEAAPRAKKAHALLNDLTASQNKLVAEDALALQNRTTKLKSTVLAALVLALALAGSIGFALIRLITRPLHSLSETVKNVEERGDLSLRADVASQDEIGQTVAAFNRLLESQQHVITEVNGVVGALADGDFSKRVEVDCQGDFKRLKSGVNTSTEQ